MIQRLILLALYANGGKMEAEKLKWAVFILLKALEEREIEIVLIKNRKSQVN